MVRIYWSNCAAVNGFTFHLTGESTGKLLFKVPNTYSLITRFNKLTSISMT